MNRRFCSLISIAFLLLTSRLTAQSPLDTVPVLDSLPHESLVNYAADLAGRAAALEQFFTEKNSRAVATRAALEEQIVFAKADTSFNKDSLKTLTTTLKASKQTERVAAKDLKRANTTANFARLTAQADSLILHKDLPKVRRQVIELAQVAYPPAPDSSASAGTSRKETEKKKKEKPANPLARYKPYDPANDVMLNPPKPPCALAVDSRDEFSGEVRRETRREELLRLTHPGLPEPVPGGFPQILGEAALTSSGTGYTLNLAFVIRDPAARKTFGGLPRGGIVILKFMDGSTFTLNNQRPDEGAADPEGRIFTYRGQYPFDRTVLKKMQKSELDKMRVAWNAGYEDYDIMQVDVLMRQAECLGK